MLSLFNWTNWFLIISLGLEKVISSQRNCHTWMRLEPKLRNLRLRSWPSARTGTDDKKLRDRSNSTKFSRSEKSMKWYQNGTTIISRCKHAPWRRSSPHTSQIWSLNQALTPLFSKINEPYFHVSHQNWISHSSATECSICGTK